MIFSYMYAFSPGQILYKDIQWRGSYAQIKTYA